MALQSSQGGCFSKTDPFLTEDAYGGHYESGAFEICATFFLGLLLCAGFLDRASANMAGSENEDSSELGGSGCLLGWLGH